MQSQIVEHLLCASPQEVQKYTGIQDWEKKSGAYTKILYNNTVLPYDYEAVYFIDKLHLTFKSQNKSDYSYYRKLFTSKQQYDVDNLVTLIPDNRRQSNYYFSFSVIVEDIHIGKINFFHTRRNNNCLLEIDNEILYCQSMSWIISGVFVIAEAFDLLFNNISVTEIARDSTTNIYKQYTEVFYQSVHCSDMVHQLNGDHRYFRSVTKCKLDDSPDENDPRVGVMRIGKSTSNISVKGYNKTKEIEDMGQKKHYIQEQHNCHFDPDKDVYRLEITAHSGTFADGGIFGGKDVDLFYLLDKRNLPQLFFSLLGNKLTFKDLRTIRWKNGNAKYDEINLLEPPPSFDFEEIPSKPTCKKYTHDRNVNHPKLIINQYLDGKIGFFFFS